MSLVGSVKYSSRYFAGLAGLFYRIGNFVSIR